jgi:hypothetical protein
VSAGTTIGFGGAGGSGFLAADLAASEELEEESAASGALASVADDEVAAWSADFWHPARAKAKQKA